MSKNWAIAIGINRYDYLQPLNYAKRDAQLIQEFLRNEAGFEKIFFFADDSPDIGGKSTRPTRTNLLRVLRQLFEYPFMGAGDNFWFFFSGHGIRHANRDYLMPCDGDPEDIENTAIAINYVTERLRRCGADNIVLILDACRSLGTRAGEGIGRQAAEEARQQGVISIFSCSPQEYSYEIEALQQGAFTAVLLEGLGIQGQCATVEKLNQHLKFRVPELVRQYKNGRQTPYVIAEPVNKSHLILVPQYATLTDIATLKNDAYRAKDEGNLDLAEQLWIRVNAAALGQDMEAVRALQRLRQLPEEPQEALPTPPSQPVHNPDKGLQTPIAQIPSPQQIPPSPHFSRRRIIQTVGFLGAGLVVAIAGKHLLVPDPKNDQLLTSPTPWVFKENLGNGVILEMVQIKWGIFMMGSPEEEKGRESNESPQHQVKLRGFFMGKYPITQEQYQVIMSSNPANFKGEKRPVEQVSWNKAVEFCEKLSQKTGRKYRLPSEAEWEYACRAGTSTPFSFGETITPDLANYGGQETKPVGSFRANNFGLYDMHGNVWEWCQDYWHENYQGAPTDGSAWLTGKDKNDRILRGGSWSSPSRRCRSAYRGHDFPTADHSYIGLRVVGEVA